MPKIKNVSGDDLIVPWLGDRLVLAGAVVEVPEEDVYASTQTVLWAPADKPSKEAHQAADEAYTAAIAAESPPKTDTDDESTTTDTTEES